MNHRPLVSSCLVLPHPSSSSCDGNLLSTHFTLDPHPIFGRPVEFFGRLSTAINFSVAVGFSYSVVLHRPLFCSFGIVVITSSREVRKNSSVNWCCHNLMPFWQFIFKNLINFVELFRQLNADKDGLLAPSPLTVPATCLKVVHTKCNTTAIAVQ